MMCPYCGAYRQSNFSYCSECGRYIRVEFKRVGRRIVSKPVIRTVKCGVCGGDMVEDRQFKRNFTYIIPYVCESCGHRDSRLKSGYGWRRY